MKGNQMMRQRVLTTGLAALAAVATMTACGSLGHQAATNTTTSAGGSAASSAAPASQAHNQTDITFAQDMIPHHQQAIAMSDIIVGKQGIDPRVVQLANQIKAAQGPEIQQMQGWLGQWGQPTVSMMPDRLMPGMLPGQDISALQNAQGVDVSKRFLSGMIGHHRGAINMAQDEIQSGQYPPAITLAHSIATSQQEQITTMQGILDSL